MGQSDSGNQETGGNKGSSASEPNESVGPSGPEDSAGAAAAAATDTENKIKRKRDSESDEERVEAVQEKRAKTSSESSDNSDSEAWEDISLTREEEEEINDQVASEMEAGLIPYNHFEYRCQQLEDDLKMQKSVTNPRLDNWLSEQLLTTTSGEPDPIVSQPDSPDPDHQSCPDDPTPGNAHSEDDPLN